MPDPSVIDQVLAKLAAAGPVQAPWVSPDKRSAHDLTPEESLVWLVYTAVEGVARGWCGESEITRCSRAATRAGIPQREVDAAIARGRAELAG